MKPQSFTFISIEGERISVKRDAHMINGEIFTGYYVLIDSWEDGFFLAEEDIETIKVKIKELQWKS